MSKNKKLIMTAVVILLLFTAGIIYTKMKDDSKAPTGYTKVKGFVKVETGQITCMAQVPQCGYCPGEVIEESCYVKKD